MKAYYNDNDKKNCAWLRELIRQRLITPGDVDERSITEVRPEDVRGYDRVHFFAGIGGWDYALNLAGWGSEKVWTGSCPCQPFSTAGAGLGFDDPRHLWPFFGQLIDQCRPPTVLGEQVTSKLGRQWLDRVRAGLEKISYAFGAANLCAAGVGSPNLRQRFIWVADADSERREGAAEGPEPTRRSVSGECSDLSVGDSAGDGQRISRRTKQPVDHKPGYWSVFEIVPCSDGGVRRIEPGVKPLVDGLPRGVVPSCDIDESYSKNSAEARSIRIRGYGNAINPELVAVFIRSFKEAKEIL